MEKTCHTFKNPAESAAFMFGFLAGRCKKIHANIDPEEPETILVHCLSDKAEGVYMGAVIKHRELRVSSGWCNETEQYIHDRNLPDA